MKPRIHSLAAALALALSLGAAPASAGDSKMTKTYSKPSQEQLKKTLTPEQYTLRRVTKA